MKLCLCINEISQILPAKQGGFFGFEYSGAKLSGYSEEEFQRLVSVKEEHSFPCIGLNAYSAGQPAIIGPNYQPDQTEAYARRICARAQRLGAKSIGIGAPKARLLPPGYGQETAKEQLKDFLKRTSKIAKDYGLTLLLEALGPNVCNFLNHTEDAARIVQELGIANVKLVFDFYHSEMARENPVEMAARYAPLISHVHVSTAEGREKRGYPLEDEKEKYQGYMKVLKETGYDGAVSIEPGFFDQELASRSANFLMQVMQRN